MNIRTLRIAMLVPTLFASIVASGAEIQVVLAPANQTVKRGEAPRFIVTVRAKASGQRIMKFAERVDLRHNYAQLIVTRNGKPVELSRIISDPGPTGVGDYVQLNPGQTMTLEHDGMPYILSELRSGRYSAVVKLQADWKLAAVTSSPVSFIVEQ